MLAQPALEASSTRDDGMKARKEVCVDSGIAWEMVKPRGEWLILSFHFPRITKAWFTRAEYLVRVVDSALEMMCVTGQEILLLQSRCAGLCVTTMSISF